MLEFKGLRKKLEKNRKTHNIYTIYRYNNNCKKQLLIICNYYYKQI